MSTQVQYRRGTTAQHASFTGAAGEITIDTNKNILVVHDGVTAGGWPTDLPAHIAATTGIHGAVSAATASMLIIRDAAGRAKVLGAGASTDIAIMSDVTGNVEDTPVAGHTTKAASGNAVAVHLADTAPHAAALNLLHCTSGDLTYYVRVDGNDGNTGLVNNAGGAFLTIGKAISMIPQIVSHVVKIIVGAGTYAESMVLQGYAGYGTISIIGDTIVSTSRSIQKIIINACSAYIVIQGFNITTTTDIGIYIQYCLSSSTLLCNIVGAGAYNGARINQAIASLKNNVISNRDIGIIASLGATVYSEINTGTGNTVGLKAENGSTIGKGGGQPGGSTAEVTSNGGVIR